MSTAARVSANLANAQARTSRLEARPQPRRPCLDGYEVLGFDCSRMPFALLSEAHLAPVRGKIRGFSGLSPFAAARVPRYSLACSLHPPLNPLPTSWLAFGFGVALGWL